MPTRRQYLTSCAAIAGGLTLSNSVAADHPDNQPSHVFIDYSQRAMETYRPLLRIRDLNVRPTALYGWRATSDNYRYDWYVYWAEYSHQDGVFSFDSHFGDHEPCYVAVSDGSVQRVVYSGYHWLAARNQFPPLYDDTHPAFRVNTPYHHYMTDAKMSGQLVEVRDLAGTLESWRDNGLEDDLDPGTVYDPETMLTRDDWWRDNTFGVSLTAAMVRASRRVGLFGAGDTDL